MYVANSEDSTVVETATSVSTLPEPCIPQRKTKPDLRMWTLQESILQLEKDKVQLEKEKLNVHHFFIFLSWVWKIESIFCVSFTFY